MRLKGIVLSFLISIITIFTLISVVDFYVNDRDNTSEWKIEGGSQFENDFVYNLAGKDFLINVNGFLNNCLLIPEMNEVVKLRNKHLVTLYDNIPEDVLNDKADEIKRASEILEGMNIDMLYLVLPYQISKYDNQLPKGYEESLNANLDYFCNRLDCNEVEYIDLREEFFDKDINQYDMWYKTDHHWNMTGALKAFDIVNEYICEKYGIDVQNDVIHEESYEKRVFPKWHLGSYGQRVGTTFGGIDDFVLYVPKFETKLINVDGEEGTLEDLVYSYDVLSNPNYTERRTYDEVLNKARGRYINEKAQNNLCVLWSGDSMLKAIMPYGIVAYQNTDYMHADEITYEYLENNRTDIVIMCISPSDYYSDEYTDSFFYFKNL